jgi:6-hydroxytryprostatin B O-methyltransferase
VPLDKAISYADLAATANVPEQRLKSIMRMAMTNSLFREQFEGKYAGHSATSAYLARNVDVHTWATYISSRTAPMALSLATAHQRWGPDTDRKNETAYNVAFNTNLPFFDHISEDEARVCEFAAYMRNVTSSKGTDLTHLVTGFAWDQIVDGGVVVDVSAAGALILLFFIGKDSTDFASSARWADQVVAQPLS